jgi:SEC-C motif domain protein
MANCPCGTGLAGPDCCDRYRLGPATAPTAEALMRSRFTAYAQHDEAYLRRTWHPDGRPARIEFDPGLRWVRLEILAHHKGSLLDATGTVRFAAHYIVDGRAGVLREHSQFVRERGAWLYVGPLN